MAEHARGPDEIQGDPGENIPVNQRPGAAEIARGPDEIQGDPGENILVNRRPGAAEHARGPDEIQGDPGENIQVNQRPGAAENTHAKLIACHFNPVGKTVIFIFKFLFLFLFFFFFLGGRGGLVLYVLYLLKKQLYQLFKKLSRFI